MSQLLNLKNILVSFGHQPLYKDANLQINTRERVALVGRNGTGKSTLLKIIAGLIQPDAGTIERPSNLKISTLTQEVPVNLSGSVFDIVASGIADVGALLQKYDHLLLLDPTEQTLKQQTKLEAQITAADGWMFQQQIDSTLSLLELDPHVDINTLSGGLKRRVLLAKALVSDPDILLLDEPTNHLDINAVLWLETFLKKFQKTVIFITHDRAFLSALATRIVEIDYQQFYSWPGNYSQYLTGKEALIVQQERDQALFDKKLAQEEVWIRQGIKARRTRNEGRVRRLEALRREKSQQFKQVGKTKVSIQSEKQSGKIVFEIENLSFGFDNKKIIDNFSAIIARGDRVGIVGPNGSGKSTLIKLLLGQLTPTSGSIKQGTQLDVAYFDQYRFDLDEKLNVMDNVGQGREFVTIDGREKHVISYLQDFLFSPDRARMPITALSGGERNRLLLAKLFTNPANLIVMDEPTNDLDIETLELLEERLNEFDGTLLIVSHDREFLNNVATQVWVIEDDGHVQEYLGGYSQWESHVSTKIPEPVIVKKVEPVKTPVKTDSKWGAAEKKELSAIPALISKSENKIAMMQDKMLAADFYQQSADKIKVFNDELNQLQKELERLYTRWEALEALKGN